MLDYKKCPHEKINLLYKRTKPSTTDINQKTASTEKYNLDLNYTLYGE